MDKNDLISAHNNQVYNNFLVHWKYIKREKITGAKKGENKWKYFYKDNKSSKNKPGIVDKIKDVVGYDERDEYENTKKKLDTARINSDNAKTKLDDAIRKYDSAKTHKKITESVVKNSAKKVAEAKKAYESDPPEKRSSTKEKTWINLAKKYGTSVKEDAKASETLKTSGREKRQAVVENRTATREYNDASKKADSAKNAYENTLLFKLTQLSDGAKATINKGKEAVIPLVDVIDNTVDEIKDAAEETKDKVSDLVDKVSDFLDPAERKAKQEAEERAEAERARQEAERARQAAEAYAKQARENALARGEEALSDLPMKTREYSKDEDQAAINPNYEEGEEWQTNCAYCTAAYDLRRRGYDVEAMPCDDATYDATLDSIPTWYEDTSKADWSGDASVDWFGRIDYDNISKIHADTKKTFDEMPDGSYGQFCVYWTIGGGHSMVWEKENGTTYIRDCQTNETVTHDEWVSYYGDWSYGAYVLRTDNRVPSENILKTVKEREDKPKEDKSKGSYTIDHDTANTYVYVYDVGQKQGTKKQLTQFK